MFNWRSVLLAFLLALVLCLGLLLGMFGTKWVHFGPSPRVYNTATILRQVQTLSQLVTVKYVMEKVEIVEDPSQNVIRMMLPDNTGVILVAHGIVKAGVDLGKLKPEDVRVSGKKIVIAMPLPEITDAYLDEKQTRVVERTTGFLREFNKDLEQNARQDALDDIRRSARASGILKDADERARAQLNQFMQQLGFETVEFAGR